MKRFIFIVASIVLSLTSYSIYAVTAGAGLSYISNRTCSPNKEAAFWANGQSEPVGYRIYYGGNVWNLIGCKGDEDPASIIDQKIDFGAGFGQPLSYSQMTIKPRWWYNRDGTLLPIYKSEGTDFSETIEDSADGAFKTWLRENNYTITNEPGKRDFTVAGSRTCSNFQDCGQKWVDDRLGGVIYVDNWWNTPWRKKAWNANPSSVNWAGDYWLRLYITNRIPRLYFAEGPEAGQPGRMGVPS